MESRDPKRRRVACSSWSHLPTDILINVASKHVTSAATYATLRSVCRSWRAALPATVPRPHRLPPQLPFLLRFPRSRHNPAGTVFSLTTNRTFTLRHLPNARESACVGSCYGWLLLLNPAYNLILCNPFTGDTIRLPSLDSTLSLHYKGNLPPDHYLLVHRAILSSDPSADRDFLVVLFTSASESRCFTWRNGDNFWTVRQHPPFLPEEIIFYEDRSCIAIRPDGECAVFDFATADGNDGFFTKVPSLPVSGSPFLVESAGNVWLITVRTATSGEDEIEIDRLDLSRLPDMVSVVPEDGDLGGRILFLGQCNSMSVASTHFPEFKGESMYFVKIRQPSLTLYSVWPMVWWLPPNLHEKLGE